MCYYILDKVIPYFLPQSVSYSLVTFCPLPCFLLNYSNIDWLLVEPSEIFFLEHVVIVCQSFGQIICHRKNVHMQNIRSFPIVLYTVVIKNRSSHHLGNKLFFENPHKLVCFISANLISAIENQWINDKNQYYPHSTGLTKVLFTLLLFGPHNPH